MKRKIFFVHAASTFILFLLVSCVTTPPPGPAEKTEGQGSAAEPPSVGHQCLAVTDWLEPFQREYFTFTTDLIDATDYQTLPQVGNLFRDSHFIPIFGFSYTENNAKKLSAFHSEVIERCIAGGQDISPVATNVIHTYRSLFAQSFARFDPTIARFARDSTRSEQWLQRALIDMAALPNNRASIERLDAEFAMRGRIITAGLWPHEQEDFAKAVTNKREEIAAATGGAIASPPPFLERGGESVEERVAGRLRDLEAIPLTVEGRQQSVDWMTSFERDFSAYNSNGQVVKARWAWILKREKIFKATKDDFLTRLAKLPTGLGAEMAHSRLLIETFPLRTDETMAVYKEYRAAMMARQKPFFRRTFELGLDKLLSVREWLSDAARTAVHGSGGRESR